MARQTDRGHPWWRTSAIVGAIVVSSTTGCGGSSTGSAVDQARQERVIRSAWTAFFDPSTSSSQRVSLLQNGTKYTGQMASLAQLLSGLSGLSASVQSVSVHGTQATVRYRLVAGGRALLPGAATGTAVEVPGHPYRWQVSQETFCGLISLVGVHC